MRKMSRTAAAIVLGAACTLPALASGAGTGASSQPMSSPSTQSTPSTAQSPSSSDTRSMGSGPASAGDQPTMSEGRSDKDMGWLGLLGLAGLLGLRRKHHDHVERDDVRRTTTTAR